MHIDPKNIEVKGTIRHAELAARGLNLPSGVGLTRDDVARVAAALGDALEP